MDVLAEYTIKELIRADIWPLGAVPISSQNRITIRDRDIEQIGIDTDASNHVFHLLLSDGTTITFTDKLMSSKQVVIPSEIAKAFDLDRGDTVVAFIDPER